MGPRVGPSVAAGRTNTGCADLSRSMDAKGKLEANGKLNAIGKPDTVAIVAGTDQTSGVRGPKMGLPAEAIVAVRSAVSMFQASGFGLGALLAEVGMAFDASLKPSPVQGTAMGGGGVEDGKERDCRNCTRRFYPCKLGLLRCFSPRSYYFGRTFRRKNALKHATLSLSPGFTACIRTRHKRAQLVLAFCAFWNPKTGTPPL